MSDYGQDYQDEGYDEFNSPERDDDYNVFEENQLDRDRDIERGYVDDEDDDEPCRYCGSRECGCHLQEDRYPDREDDALEADVRSREFPPLDSVEFMTRMWSVDHAEIFANYDADRSGW
jgi:hypothetical protein